MCYIHNFGGENYEIRYIRWNGSHGYIRLFKKVIDLTHATKDQEHIHVLIDNNTEIPDRTNFILNHGEDPGREMIRSAIKLEMMGADVLAMPCNTAHYFYGDIDAFTDIPVIHMIDETAKYVLDKMPEKKKFSSLSNYRHI